MGNRDYTSLKLCQECGKAAKFVRREPDGSPFRFICGKHMGIHRRLVTSYRSNKWTTEHHQGFIDGAVEMTAVEKAESLLNFTLVKKEDDEARWAAATEKQKQRERDAILNQPKWLRERVKNHHYEQKNTNFTRKVEVVSDERGVQIELMNWSYIKSRQHAEALIGELNWALQKLDEETVKWDDEMVEKIAKADAAKAALEATEA